MDRNERYWDGYRNGYADALLGHRSEIALTAPNAAYAYGYRNGQLAREAERRAQWKGDA